MKMITLIQPGDRVRFTLLQRVKDSYGQQRVPYAGVVESVEDGTVRVKLDHNGHVVPLAWDALEVSP